eukprot:GHVR01037327.1.p1 GENE.GHVR01037327.1~~GHVR01037327.1.p1  ORF type:complete len:210 (-),score=17.23 GHVR01037327.1:159-767(-)
MMACLWEQSGCVNLEFEDLEGRPIVLTCSGAISEAIEATILGPKEINTYWSREFVQVMITTAEGKDIDIIARKNTSPQVKKLPWIPLRVKAPNWCNTMSTGSPEDELLKLHTYHAHAGVDRLQATLQEHSHPLRSCTRTEIAQRSVPRVLWFTHSRGPYYHISLGEIRVAASTMRSFRMSCTSTAPTSLKEGRAACHGNSII